MTIEDPIEFVHTNDQSVFTQREIGEDVPTFAEGVKAAIREDPDCLLVGEMRDLETIRMALTAAETGLLVFATLHTNSAAKAIDRIIDAFPAAEQEQIRTSWRKSSARWSPSSSSAGARRAAAAAFEVLIGSTALSNAIREGKTGLINNQIQTGKSKGMISMDQSLSELVRSGARRPRRGAGARARQGVLQVVRRDPSEGAPARAGAVDDAAGTRKMKREPPPGRASTSTVPPCRSAMRATMARPKPAPSDFVE